MSTTCSLRAKHIQCEAGQCDKTYSGVRCSKSAVRHLQLDQVLYKQQEPDVTPAAGHHTAFLTLCDRRIRSKRKHRNAFDTNPISTRLPVSLAMTIQQELVYLRSLFLARKFGSLSKNLRDTGSISRMKPLVFGPAGDWKRHGDGLHIGAKSLQRSRSVYRTDSRTLLSPLNRCHSLPVQYKPVRPPHRYAVHLQDSGFTMDRGPRLSKFRVFEVKGHQKKTKLHSTSSRRKVQAKTAKKPARNANTNKQSQSNEKTVKEDRSTVHECQGSDDERTEELKISVGSVSSGGGKSSPRQAEEVTSDKQQLHLDVSSLGESGPATSAKGVRATDDVNVKTSSHVSEDQQNNMAFSGNCRSAYGYILTGCRPCNPVHSVSPAIPSSLH